MEQMTIRKQILDSLVNSLSLITTDNGYNNTVSDVSKKYNGDDFSSPAIWVSLGEESRSQDKDEQFSYTCNLDAYLTISLQVNTDLDSAGTLADLTESMIEDIDNHLEHTHIPSDYCCTLNRIEGMQSWGISKIDPILDDESNRTYLLITINITYLKQE